MIRTLIVDDEPLARRNLKSFLKEAPDLQVVGECRNGAEAISYLGQEAVDLIFLDIQMPEMDGFQAIAGMPRPLPVIIFVTAYDQFALQAFEVNAIDYLLKPIDKKRFESALLRARALIASKNFLALEAKIDAMLAMRDVAAPKEYLKKIPVKSGSRLTFVMTEEIDFIAANDYYAAIQVGPKAHLVRQSIKELEERLDPSIFLRVHRSAIVNMTRVVELRHRPGGGHSVVMRDGQVLKLSRSRWEEVRSRLSR